MENKNEFKKKIREFSIRFANVNNFCLYKRTLLIRSKNHILQIICFDFPPSGLQCHVAIQPLYVPEDSIHFSFGERLNFLDAKVPGLWGIKKNKEENDILEIENLLNTNALSWFEKVSSPTNLVNFIKEGACQTIKCHPYLHSLYMGFSHLYLKKYDLAVEPLSDVLVYSSDFIGELKTKTNNLIEPILSKIKSKHYSSIDEDISSFIVTTMVKCKLFDTF